MALFNSQMRRHMINRGSYISAQALLNSFNELGEKIKCEIAEHCIPQYRSTIVLFYLSYNTKKCFEILYYWHENAKILPCIAT